MKYRKRTTVKISKKILFAIAALPVITTAYAGDVARNGTEHAQIARHEIPKQPKKGWKISAKDYAELVDDCGESSDSLRKDRTNSARNTRRQSESE